MRRKFKYGLILLTIFFFLVVIDRVLKELGYNNILYYLGYIIGYCMQKIKSIFV